MRVLCIRNVSFEGPGSIAQWAKRRGHAFTEARGGQGLPDLDSFEFLVVLGGRAEQRRFIAGAADEGKRVLGICLGAQLLAVALGGRVFRNPELEIGWYPVTKTGAGQQADVFAGWPRSFMAGHWHGDTFEPPGDAPIALISEACLRQGFAMHGGRVVGLQFHLEWTEHALERLIEESGDQLVPAAHVQTDEMMRRHPELFSQTRELLFDLLDRMEALA
jgi:GMP synthase-like glutamine amidotransferase